MVLIVASLQHTSSYVRLLCRLIIGEIHQSSRNGHFLSLLSAQILRSVLINICKGHSMSLKGCSFPISGYTAIVKSRALDGARNPLRACCCCCC